MSQPVSPPTSPARFVQKLTLLIMLGAGLILTVGIGRLAWTGRLARYWADDYCYSMMMAAGGWLRGPLNWFMSSGNRFSTIYMVGLQDSFGAGAIRFLPAAVLTAWLGAWIVFLLQLRRTVAPALGIPAVLAFAALQVYFAALLAPDRLQTLYWRMGTLHYTFPLSLLLLNLALCLVQFRRAAVSAGLAAVTAGLAFFAGGFSETYVALQAGLFGLGIAAGLAFLPSPLKRRSAAILSPGLVGSLLAMGLMLLSPSNTWRQAALPPPASPGPFLVYTVRYTFDFIRDTLRGMPLPLLALGVLSAGLAYAGYWRVRSTALKPVQALGAAALWLAAGLLLTASAVAPSVYAGLQFPAGRALMPTRFILLACLSAACICLGALPRGLVRPGSRTGQRVEIAVLLALLAGGLYAVRLVVAPIPEQAQLSAWAVRWDARDAAIRSARAAGQRDLLVQEVEVVRGLEDLGPDPHNWVNGCAAAYYRVSTITARP
jgi:hypothetical protein